MLGFLSFAFFLIGALLSYFIWIRPILRARPAFADFYARSESRWAAFVAKFNSIKTKLSATLLMIASGLVSLHDFIVPVVTGIDWTPLYEKVPAWIWPLISFALGALFLWLRTLTAKTQEKQLEAVAAGASVQESAVQAGLAP